MGFSACYPAGWLVAEHEDPEQATRWVDLDEPTSDRSTGEGLKLISVRVSPNLTGSIGEEFLNAAAIALIDKYSGVLVGWPRVVEVDGREAVAANYEHTVPYQTGPVEVVGWETVLLADEQQWTIEVAGRREYREELEGIHNEFLSHLDIAPLSGG